MQQIALNIPVIFSHTGLSSRPTSPVCAVRLCEFTIVIMMNSPQTYQGNPYVMSSNTIAKPSNTPCSVMQIVSGSKIIRGKEAHPSSKAHRPSPAMLAPPTPSAHSPRRRHNHKQQQQWRARHTHRILINQASDIEVRSADASGKQWKYCWAADFSDQTPSALQHISRQTFAKNAFGVRVADARAKKRWSTKNHWAPKKEHSYVFPRLPSHVSFPWGGPVEYAGGSRAHRGDSHSRAS
ncbi:hypothetical protein ECC02_000959 [Trypanosoma cruzi]|uniref:Uncharacterized protein n=1 Tax=Trypanosoma cruzi TaxID=5693 RepID=A0A7J6YH39_TRYCR|nr:hypothetical protein ECC02_000959 [Trypanosoma cruzi]